MQRDGGPGAGGPGAGGNPTGGSFTGAASTIEFQGVGVWGGWSGWKAVANGADATLFNFRSPSSPLVIEMYWSFDYDAMSSDKFFGIEITFGGITIWKPRVETRHIGEIGGSPLANRVKFVLPSRTEFVLKGQTDDDGTECGAFIVANEI